jgi:hypothetical protein
METAEAKNISGRLILKYLTISLLIGEIVFFFLETRGDLANGILFFLDKQFNAYMLITAALLYGCCYLFSRIAGYSIRVKRKNPWLTVAFYGGITFVAVIYVLNTVLFYRKIGSMFADILEGGRTGIRKMDKDVMSFYQIDIPLPILAALFAVLAMAWLALAQKLKNKYLTPAQ